jgi:peptide deformylase
MTKRDIIILPDPRLRQVSAPLATVTPTVRQLADDMLETMYAAPGIGLAAIQIAEPVRVVTIDINKDENNRNPFVFVNPQIVWSSKELNVYQEGCLSIPEYFEDVERPQRIKITYLDRDGASCEMEADGLLATCLQHEIDHLNGVLFIDHLSRLKRDRVVKKYTKMARERERD